jgi:hypothetical protein
MKRLLTLTLVIIFLATNILCNKPIEDLATENPAPVAPSVTYIIKQGEQFCTPNPFVTTVDSQLNFIAVFDSTCIYTTADSRNQNDINKLFGFSDCNTHHLENSARIGWRWSKDSLRIFAYVHNNSNIIFKEITTAEIGKEIKCNITCTEGEHLFKANEKDATLPRHCLGNYTRYKLYPYFGGDELAPHKIEIKITEL